MLYFVAASSDKIAGHLGNWKLWKDEKVPNKKPFGAPQNQMIIHPKASMFDDVHSSRKIPVVQVLLILTVQNSELSAWNFKCSCYFGLNVAPEDGEMESEKKVVEELRYLRWFWVFQFCEYICEPFVICMLD